MANDNDNENALAQATFCAAFQHTARQAPDATALRTASGERRFSWRDYARRVEAIARALAAIGVGRGDSVALLMSNRPEFYFCDTAVVHLGAVPFSIYSTASPEQFAYYLNHAECRVAICEPQFAAALDALRADTPLQTIVCLDADTAGTLHLAALEDAAVAGAFDFDAAWRRVAPDDTLTLIYTSGTTGAPKAVEISHANMLAGLNGTQHVHPVRRGDLSISYLPPSHVADRWLCLYMQILYGTEIVTVANMAETSRVLAETHPDFWGAPPRLYEKMKSGIEAMIAAEPEPTRREAVLGALDIGYRRGQLMSAGRTIDASTEAAWRQADTELLAPLRQRIGLDRARWCVVGGAPSAPGVVEFFTALGLPMIDAWGASELTMVSTSNPVGRARFGSVGHPVRGVELRIARDGEVLVRGATVMKGYRNDPARTAEAVSADGWYHSGDLGHIDADGYLVIVDRKKEIIISAGGKNMSPANIEGVVREQSPLIGMAVCIGDGRPYNVALIVLDADVARARSGKTSIADCAADAGIAAAVAQAIELANERLSRVEQIKKFHILPELWAPGSDVLTHTAKLKRKPIDNKYAALIQQLYAS